MSSAPDVHRPALTDFRAFATEEAEGLVHQLLARRVDLPIREWQTIRLAFDAAAQRAEAALSAGTSEDESKVLAAMVERLIVVVGEQVEAAVSHVSEEAQAATDVLRQELAEQVNRATELEASLGQALEQVESLTNNLAGERSQSEALRADLARTRDEFETASKQAQAHAVDLARDLGRLREEQAQTEAALRVAEASWQKDARAKEAAARELQTLREALDVLRTNYAGMNKQLDSEVAEARAANETLRGELDQQSNRTAELEASSSQIRAQANALTQDLQTERHALEATRTELARVREAHALAEATLRASETGWQKDLRSKEAAERDVQSQRSALDQIRAEFTRVSRQLDTEVTERTNLASKLRAAQEALDAAESGRQALADQLAAAQAGYRQRSQTMERELEQLRTEAGRSAETAREAAAEVERLGAETNTLKGGQIHDLRDRVVGAVSQPLDGLLLAYRRFAASQTVADVLTALVDGFAKDFARVALFTVKQDCLEGAQQIGFATNDVIDRAIPLSSDSLLSEAVKSGRVQGRTGRALTDPNQALFGGTPGFVLVVPIVIHGKVLAVVYADDSGRPPTDFTTPEQRVKFAQLLLCLAVSRMPRLIMEPRDAEQPHEHTSARRASP